MGERPFCTNSQSKCKTVQHFLQDYNFIKANAKDSTIKENHSKCQSINQPSTIIKKNKAATPFLPVQIFKKSSKNNIRLGVYKHSRKKQKNSSHFFLLCSHKLHQQAKRWGCHNDEQQTRTADACA